MKKADKIEALKAELERLTGKMVQLRDRKAFNARMRKINKAWRDRQKAAAAAE
jgi:hypothetical protein